MRKLILHIAIVLAIVGFVAIANGANLDDHQQYRIVSYSFSTDDLADAGKAVNFGPLLITGSASDILTDNIHGTSGYGLLNDPKSATDVFAVSADFSATPELSLRGAIGITKNRWEASLDSDYDTSWEANLGVIYKLFNNLRYEVHFGYMDTGDLFRETHAYKDVESIYMISNKLTMSF